MKDENLLVFLDNHKWHPDKEIVKRVSPSIWLIRGWGFLWCICWKGHQVGLHIISPATSTTIYLCFKILLWGPQIKYKHSHLMLNIRIPPFSMSIYWVGKKKKNYFGMASKRELMPGCRSQSRLRQQNHWKQCSQQRWVSTKHKQYPLNFVSSDRLKFGFSIR